MGIVVFENGARWPESFDYIDAFDAYSNVELRDTKPYFAEGYKNQSGKYDDIAQNLTRYLHNEMTFPFYAIAGNGRVAVVTLRDSGNTAYVFFVNKARFC